RQVEPSLPTGAARLVELLGQLRQLRCGIAEIIGGKAMRSNAIIKTVGEINSDATHGKNQNACRHERPQRAVKMKRDFDFPRSVFRLLPFIYFSALSRSAIRSSTCSMPTDKRTSVSLMPSLARVSGGTEA